MQTVRIYTKPEDEPCIQCDMTRKWLIAKKVEFIEEDIYENPQDLEAIRELGLGSAPVVIVSQGIQGDEIFWAGFQPALLSQHITLNTK